MPWEVDVNGKPVWVDVPQTAVAPKFTQPLVEGGPKSVATPERIAKDTSVLAEYRDYLKATSGLSDKEIDKVLDDLYNTQRTRRQFDATQGKEVKLKVEDVAWPPKPTPVPAGMLNVPGLAQFLVKEKPQFVLPPDKPIGLPPKEIPSVRGAPVRIMKRDLNPGV